MVCILLDATAPDVDDFELYIDDNDDLEVITLAEG
jgi:hypothetical protein